MARISTIGADRVALKLETQSEAGRKKGVSMMEAGAEILMRYARANIVERNLEDTGELFRSVTHTDVIVDPDGAHVEVTYKGSRTRGKKQPRKTRNAAIGFIQNYGRKYRGRNRPATNYHTNATSEAKPIIIEKWTEMMHGDN